MKKLLALVLALVMTLGLATVSASASVSYSDDADISYEEAVDVMSALGVFAGMDDGKFDPKGTLTREQGTKIIAYMILGQKAADSLSTAGAPFSDVAADRWSAGSIAYCTSEGIIAGKGDGTFGPAEELTGYAFAKMLLVALGYNAEQEGLTGESWSINTAKLAINAGLKKGGLSDIVMGKGITREEACQMAFNTEKATLVEYANNTTVTAGDIKFSSTSKATKVEAVVATTNPVTYEGYLDNNNDAYQQFCEQYAGDLLLDTNAGTDAFSRPANTWKVGTEKVGTYAKEADASYTGKVTKGTLYDLYGKTNFNAMTDAKATSAAYAAAKSNQLTVIVDGKTSTTLTKDKAMVSGSSAAAVGTGNGTTTDVYIDDNNNLEIIVINEYVVKAAADYNANTKSVKVAVPTGAAKPEGTGTISTLTLSSDDFAVEGVKKNDYLVVTVANTTSTNYAIQSIAPATEITGKVNSYSGSNVTLDGTKYSYVGNIKEDDTHGKTVAYAGGENATVIVDANNYIVYVDEALTASDNWVYIAKCAAQTTLEDAYVATAVFTDGSTKTITVDSYTNDHNTNGTNVTYDTSLATTDGGHSGIATGWYTYTVKDDGSYKLYADFAADNTAARDDGAFLVTSGTTTGNALLDKDSGTGIVIGVTHSAGTASKGNNATIYLVKNSDKNIDVYTGVSKAPVIKAKNSTAVTAYYVNNTSGFARFVYIDASAATTTDAIATNSELVYFLKSASTNVDAKDNKYVTYEAIVDGEKTTVDVAYGTSITLANADGGLYYSLKTNSNGYVNNTTAAAGNKNNVAAVDKDLTNVPIAYSEGILSLDGVDFTTDENTKVYLVMYSSNTNAAVNELMSDSGATYELTITDAEGLANALVGYKFTDGSYQVVYSGTSTSGTVSAIYITVTALTAIS